MFIQFPLITFQSPHNPTILASSNQPTNITPYFPGRNQLKNSKNLKNRATLLASLGEPVRAAKRFLSGTQNLLKTGMSRLAALKVCQTIYGNSRIWIPCLELNVIVPPRSTMASLSSLLVQLLRFTQ